MGFHRVDTSNVRRGAGRIMYAAIGTTKPADIADVINVTSYDAVSPWEDLGATREGIQITINNTESGFDVDQVAGLIDVAPEEWEVFVTTRLAEITLENMVLAWEGAAITTDTAPTPDERETGFVGATTYTERRMAVLFREPKAGGITAHFFHRAVRAPQESGLDYRRGGDPMTIQVRFRILADDTETDPAFAFFRVREQIIP